jgi:hypothetical protein
LHCKDNELCNSGIRLQQRALRRHQGGVTFKEVTGKEALRALQFEYGVRQRDKLIAPPLTLYCKAY